MVPSLILLMDKWTHHQELPLVVQPATVAVMATLLMETTLGSVGVMECGVTHNLHAIVRYIN